MKIKKLKKGKYADIEEQLMIWFKQAESADRPIKKIVLKEKAEEIAEELNIDFVGTNRWCDKMEKRFLEEKLSNVVSKKRNKKDIRINAAKAKGTADGASTSDCTTTDSSVEHSCNCTLEKKDGTCLSSQECGALLPSGNGDIITPDLEMRSSGETEMETQSPSLLNGSGIVIKQEIIETEEESSTFNDTSFHPPFIDGPSDGQRPGTSDTFDDSSFHPPSPFDASDGQRPGTSDTTHSDLSNSNCSAVISEPALVATTSINSSVKVQPSVSLNSCYVGPEKQCGISNLESFVKQVGVPSLPQTITYSNHGQVYNPYYGNPNVQSNNEPIQVGVPYHAGSPSLPQTLSSSNHGQASNNNYAHSNGQSYPSVPFRQRDNFDIFGEFVASKLRSLDLKSAAYVQSAFSDLMYKVESRMLANSNGKRLSDTQTDNSEINPSLSKHPKEKENIQPSLPPTVSNTGSEISSRTEPNQPVVGSQNLCPPVSNPTIPEITVNDSTTISSQSNNTSGPSGLNTTTSCKNTAIQPGISFQSRPSGPYHAQPCVPYHTQPSIPYNARPGVPYHTEQRVPYTQTNVPYNTLHSVPCNTPYCVRPKDRFDNFGEFVASKLRILDSKSCVFVETAFADLIFKAELGKFTSEKSFLANRTNDFHQNRLGSNVPSSQTTVVSSVPGGYMIPPQVNFVPQNYGVGPVPFVNVPPNYVAVTNNS